MTAGIEEALVLPKRNKSNQLDGQSTGGRALVPAVVDRDDWRKIAFLTMSASIQLLAPVYPPQPLLAAQSFIERHGLQLIHNPGSRPHHAVTIPEQLLQIPVLPARHPDSSKAVFQQQTQDQLRILAIRLLVCARAECESRPRISDPHNSNCNSATSRSNQRPCPLASIPTQPFWPASAR